MVEPSPSEAIIDLYDRNASGWAEDRGAELRLEGAWLDRFTAPLKPGAEILDIGCGNGDPIARHLLGKGFAVTGHDASGAQIAMAAERMPAPKWPAARWLVGDMRALDLGRRFDAILAWHSLFHLTPDDQRTMFPRFARHACPGAPLMFTSGAGHGDLIGSWRGEPLYHGSLDASEYRRLMDANGFDLVEHRPGDPDCGGAYVWLARKRS